MTFVFYAQRLLCSQRLQGTLKMIARSSKPSLTAVFLSVLFCLTCFAHSLPAKELQTPAKTADTTSHGLNGTWILESGKQGKYSSQIGLGWFSTVTFENGKFTVSRFYQSNKDFTGTFTVDPKVNTIDLKTNKFDFAELGAPMVFPETQLKGLYQLSGDRLAICFRAQGDSPRPSSFDIPENEERFLNLVLNRAPKSFKGFPEKVVLKVVDQSGTPIKGATVTRFLQQNRNPALNRDRNSWELVAPRITDEKGMVQLSYEELGGQAVVAWQKETRKMAVADVSPWSCTQGAITLTLLPESQTHIKVRCPDLNPARTKENVFHTYVQNKSGQPFLLAFEKSGEFHYPLPPGDYTLMIYGRFFKRIFVPFSVPEGKAEFTLPEISVEASRLPGLIGEPAPSLESVTGWKGQPVNLTSLKGKIVLLEFWGYWCGPCIESMPILFSLHDRFKDKDLVIVGVHIDIDGDVPDAATLDKKIAKYRQETWKGRDLPFSIGLFNGTKAADGSSRGAIAQTYGIQSYPTTILIDRAGKVVGEFHARDEKSAIQAMEKLLEVEKKK